MNKEWGGCVCVCVCETTIGHLLLSQTWIGASIQRGIFIVTDFLLGDIILSWLGGPHYVSDSKSKSL